MRDDIILLGHGSGGLMTERLIEKIIIPNIHNGNSAQEMDDAALIDLPAGRTFFTTDSYVVDPFIFPGGNIGELAVNGTVNDLAMRGAMPVAISVGLILEEGLEVNDLGLILRSMGDAARAAGVKLACGDTKVVPRGRGDKIFINTSGIGVAQNGFDINCGAARPGDAVLVNGTIGDHGVAIMLAREGLNFESPVVSDTAALNGLVKELLDGGVTPKVLRDPTRGGLATTLVEIAEASNVSIRLNESDLPVAPATLAACEILGLDPLMIANEGKMIAIVPADEASKALSIMRSHPEGENAALVGVIENGPPGRVSLASVIGGSRLVTRLDGELLPRIC